ncbi:Hypothetical predicted protein [Olea europaea subsp. europaea]|uniref:Uncharacterized protein n=1 Tax=Olea europaea subsp. europaea TaxID=158383 RepID=A0A8S0PYN7_OLEEU|nr:Hypothetical predicted protein [Olea europaea subsp. europaea]
MTEVQYEKAVPSDRSRGEKRKGGSIDRSVHRAGTSINPSDSGMKQSTPMLLITDEQLGHSDVYIDDDEFVEPPPSWKGTSIYEDFPSGERKSNDTTDSKELPSKDVAIVEKSVNSKGKVKVDSASAIEFSCSIEPPYLNLNLEFIQPSQFVAKTSKEVEVQVDSIISNVLKETECIEQEVMKNYHKSIQFGRRSLYIDHMSLHPVTCPEKWSQVTAYWSQFIDVWSQIISFIISSLHRGHRSLHSGHISLYIGYKSLHSGHMSLIMITVTTY